MVDPTKFFRLRTPCSSCPFRTDKKFYLAKGRAADIAENIRMGNPFHCHKTVDYNDEEPRTDQSALCAGAMIVQAKQGAHDRMVQLAQRLLDFDPAENLNMQAPVPDSMAEWIEFMDGE